MRLLRVGTLVGVISLMLLTGTARDGRSASDGIRMQ